MTVTFTDDAIGCTNIKPCAQGEGMALALGAGAERDVLCKNIFAQPDGTYWIVVNTLRYPDPDEPDANGATINNMLALGHIVAGDTVEALAGEMGVDAANLQASIDAYNAVVEARHRRVRLRGRQHRRCGHDRGPLVRLPQGAHRAPHDGRHPRECGIRGLQRRRRADSRLCTPQASALAASTARTAWAATPSPTPDDLRPQRRHQRRKSTPWPSRAITASFPRAAEKQGAPRDEGRPLEIGSVFGGAGLTSCRGPRPSPGART